MGGRATGWKRSASGSERAGPKRSGSMLPSIAPTGAAPRREPAGNVPLGGRTRGASAGIVGDDRTSTPVCTGVRSKPPLLVLRGRALCSAVGMPCQRTGRTRTGPTWSVAEASCADYSVTRACRRRNSRASTSGP
jgi:hypothetical protein